MNFFRLQAANIGVLFEITDIKEKERWAGCIPMKAESRWLGGAARYMLFLKSMHAFPEKHARLCEKACTPFGGDNGASLLLGCKHCVQILSETLFLEENNIYFCPIETECVSADMNTLNTYYHELERNFTPLVL